MSLFHLLRELFPIFRISHPLKLKIMSFLQILLPLIIRHISPPIFETNRYPRIDLLLLIISQILTPIPIPRIQSIHYNLFIFVADVVPIISDSFLQIINDHILFLFVTFIIPKIACILFQLIEYSFSLFISPTGPVHLSFFTHSLTICFPLFLSHVSKCQLLTD